MRNIQKWLLGWIKIIVGITLILTLGKYKPDWELNYITKVINYNFRNKKGPYKEYVNNKVL